MSQIPPQNDEKTQASPDVSEMAGSAESGGAEGDALEALHHDLQEMKDKAQVHWDQFVRAQAELDNLRKRAERDLANAHKYALERFANELLPVKDSLEMGMSAAEGAEGDSSIREGMALTLRMFAQVLTKFGIEEVNPVGERFDPERHQAMTMQPSDEQPPNTVLAVMQKGYVLNDRLLRPAMVVVSKSPT
ncbi:nucleotide exchange factor GrpE [Acidihalobacter yilgarnensis]|uniref:Protein GrpE n=1 Tax=Acidihalobacter yilgarnensis TaxID=2819280 RepID=A0A1D8ISX2_9GAMM|nr:nucleotide exchange factor GrpE [Acidihalobacter yilgarnensis]AOU99579.1 nucleotide exchange factor GrpE [Acidihalobacter yilgarnensis]